MQPLADDRRAGFQRNFHSRWSHLRDPHVRTLAWLLDSPDMLDPAAPQWQGRIASFGPDAALQAAPWLRQLDQDPEPLHRWLAVNRFTRLGRYAEQLLTWYFREQGSLVAHNLQVRSGGTTIGEFDFLLREGGRLVHWELATKVYLLQASRTDSAALQADYFVGPNLADTLGAKMSKIIHRQLGLSVHPAARAVLTEPVQSVAALIKGWLFYPAGASLPPQSLGLSADHCRGFWCQLGELDKLELGTGERYLPLERLQWMTPVAAALEDTTGLRQLQAALHERFVHHSMPVMIARMQEQGDNWIEVERGFVVPDDWASRAGRRTGATLSPLA